MSPSSFWGQWLTIQEKIGSAKQLFLFLDYDGTLVPIRDHPAKARITSKTKQLLKKLSLQNGICLALVSGRALRELKRMVGLKNLIYVGNHGLELQGPKIHHVNPAAAAAKPILRRLAQNLKKALLPIRGAWVEDKGLTLSVHYRKVKPKDLILVRNAFHETIRPERISGKIQVTTGRAVFEVRPPVRWNKGTIILWFLAHASAFGSASALPIYMGDDTTDEDAFEALKSKGVTIAVGPSTPLTQAQYSLSNTQEVHRLLKLILDTWKKRGPSSVVRRRPLVYA